METPLSMFVVLVEMILLISKQTISETIDRNINPDYTPVTCTTFPCIINCIAQSSCRQTNISCPLTGEGDCIINLPGKYAAQDSIIYTHGSTNINITIDGSTDALRYSTIYAHTKIGAKLRIHAWSDNAMRNSKLFAPYGVGSEVTLICGGPTSSLNYQCAYGEYFVDYSTTVTVEGYRNYAVESTIFMNIFRNNSYFQLAKDISIPISYRGSVTLYSDRYAFRDIKYFGTDHGDWTIQSDNPDTDAIDFRDAVIYADHSFITTESYTISVTSTSREAMHLYIYAAQNNGNILLRGLAQNAFWNGDTGTRYLTVDCTSSLTGIVMNSFVAISTLNNAFYRSTLNINIPIRSVTFRATYQYGFRLGTYTFGNVLNDVKLIANGTDATNSQQEFYQINLNIASIQGDFIFIDSSARGKTLYDSFVSIGPIGGNVILGDDSVSDGYIGFSTEFTFGNIAGNMHIFTTGIDGFSFREAVFNVGDIGGNLIVNDTAEAGHALRSASITGGNVGGDLIIIDDSIIQGSSGGRTCYLANFIFGDITGKVDLISTAAGYGYSFESSTFNINSIGNDLTAHDISEDGRSFYNSYFNIGIVYGSVLFKDEAWGTDGGNAIQSADIIIERVLGDIDLIDSSIRGRSFYETNFDFQFIGGHLYCDGYRDTIYDETFRKTTWNINHTIGNITFRGYSAFHGDSTSIMNIYNPKGDIFFYSVGGGGIRKLNSYFGGNTNVEIIIEGGTNAIYQSTFDCRDCETFTLTCNNDADCDGYVDIYCPQNNSKDKCKIYCSTAASCNGMEIWTTNGYCQDVRMYCADTITHSCNFGSNTRVYCTNGVVAYGTNDYSCPMQQDITNNNQWFCGIGTCANTCTERPTTDPTPAPTTFPTPAPTTDPTSSPTPAPTINPTPAPTSDPTDRPSDSPVAPGDPTKAPSFPTELPTQYPTKYPTKNPSSNPTNDPTNDPTIDPTNDPTIDPTNDPTLIPTNRPSPFPTYNPTENVGGIGTTSTQINENTSINDNFVSEESFIEKNLMMVIIAGLIGAVLIVLCALFCVYCKKRNQAKNDNNNLQNMERMKSNSTLMQTTNGTDTTTNEIKGETHEVNIQMTQQISPVSPVSSDDGINENNNNIDAQMIDLYGNNNALKMWLNNLNLMQYFDSFKEQGFSDHLASLTELTDQDLKDMGIKLIAHRRTIMKEIQNLKSNMTNGGNENGNKQAINLGNNNYNYNNNGNDENSGEELFQSENNNNNQQTTGFSQENVSNSEDESEHEQLYAKSTTAQ